MAFPKLASKDEALRPALVTPVFLRVTFATFAYFVSIGALIPTLPRYVEGPLGGGSIAVGVTIGTFSLAAVLTRPVVGRLGDLRGRRLLIVVGGLLSALSAAGYLLAGSLIPLIVLRLAGGVGEAFLYVGAASAINDLAPDERRGEALSYFSLALYAGLALGPLLGEWALGASGFDLVWTLSAISSFVATFIGLGVPDTRPQDLQEETTSREGRSRLFVHPAGLLPGALLVTSVLGLGGFNTFVPLYALTIGLGGSRLVFALFSAIVLSVRSLGARIPDALGPTTAARAALTGSAVGLATIGLWPSPVGLFVGAAIFAVGQSLAFPALMTLAVRGAAPSERGAVVGTFTAFFDLAFGLGAVSLGGVADVLGYRGSFLTAGAVAALGVLVLFMLRRNDRQ